MLAISIRASAAGYVELFLEEGTATGEFTLHCCLKDVVLYKKTLRLVLFALANLASRDFFS